MKTFRDAIRTQEFALSAELSLTPDSDAGSIIEQARILQPYVDAIQVTENQYGAIHLSPLAAASILINENIDPVMQLSCCNRNRAALIGDLLGAIAVGVSSLLLVRGKKMPDSYQPQPKLVTDIAVDELIGTARVIEENSESTSTAGFLIGAVTRAHVPKSDWAAPRLLRKIDAGAQFVQTQICFDMNVMRKFVARLVHLKLLRRCSVVADVAVMQSAESARWIRDNLSHVLIPNNVIRRLERAEDPEREGIAIASERLQEISRSSKRPVCEERDLFLTRMPNGNPINGR
jgi:methylenetetrahydrofolate reductase (NADPH)